jgi:hypothetical protein
MIRRKLRRLQRKGRTDINSRQNRNAPPRPPVGGREEHNWDLSFVGREAPKGEPGDPRWVPSSKVDGQMGGANILSGLESRTGLLSTEDRTITWAVSQPLRATPTVISLLVPLV